MTESGAPSGPRIGPPVTPPARVRRPRLDAALDRTFDRRLTVVTAGPGFGKTSAVSGWVRRRPVHRFAWLTLDQVDNTTQAFWTDVLAAIRASGAVPAGSALDEIQPATVFGAREWDLVLAALADLRERLVLVLDDFHLLTDPQVLESVASLLTYLSGQLRLVITSRADPPLPLHRIRVAGHLTEIRGRDLAFTLDEAADLFRQQGFDLEPDQVAQLHRRTEGWSAGLGLAALSLDRADPAAGIDRVTGTDRAIAEYLIGEVVQQATPSDREFLLSTSVVDRLSADLADQLTGRTDGARVLTRLLADNAFVTGLDDTWVVYHPLLRELLRHRLASDHPDLVPELHRRAAAWLAADGEPIESLRYSIRAGDWDQAGLTLLSCVTLIVSAQASTLAATLRPLAARASTHPGLFPLVAACAVHMEGTDYAAMHQDILDARPFLDDVPAHLRSTATVVLDLFDTAYHRMTGNADALLALARSTMQMLDGTSRRELPMARHFLAIGATNLATALLWTGDLLAAGDVFAESERQLGEVGLEISLLNTATQETVLDAMLGRCRRVEQRGIRTLRMIERRGWGSEPQALSIYLGIGLLHLIRGDAAAAAPVLAHGLAISGDRSDRTVRLGLMIAAVELAVARVDPDAALEATARLRAALFRTPDAPDHLRRWAAVACATTLILAGRPGPAAAELRRPGDDRDFCTGWERVTLARAHLDRGEGARVEALVHPVIQPGWPFREQVVTARLLLGAVAEGQHRDGIALEHLTAAIEAARIEGIRRPFHQLAPRLTGALRRYRVLGGPHVDFVAGFVDEPPVDAADAAVPAERLTERELVIVRYLPTMLKASEIAADLFVSVNTVKAHLRSIYRKLDATNRREAVERARAQGLL
ncbi:LuxR C-terminal-related transcriptional regulator [Nakamurella sp.]|uniref:LuxR C-terminal-related transcriptional regulator n=1 Tax=Nakamurella sp. TaxID=1869182 RepID=UPI003B3A0697